MTVQKYATRNDHRLGICEISLILLYHYFFWGGGGSSDARVLPLYVQTAARRFVFNMFYLKRMV